MGGGGGLLKGPAEIYINSIVVATHILYFFTNLLSNQMVYLDVNIVRIVK